MTYLKIFLLALGLFFAHFFLPRYKTASVDLSLKMMQEIAERFHLQEVSCSEEKKILHRYIACKEFSVSFLVKDDVYFWNFIKNLHKSNLFIIISREIVLEHFLKEGQQPWLKGRYCFLCVSGRPAYFY